MEKILQLETVTQYNKFYDQETLHPLVAVIDFENTTPSEFVPKMNLGFYGIYLKDENSVSIKYGRNYYDYQEDTLVFVSPGQIISINHEGREYEPKGHALIFHPDLLRGTNLAKNMRTYSFFNYDVREALHLSKKERKIVLECFSKIRYELENNIDKHSKSLIISNIELFLNYCIRFYDRQFISRTEANLGTLGQLEKLLNEYFTSDQLLLKGIPSVGYCADQLNLSANYFGDLVKKETGKTALEYINLQVMELAKERILDTSKTINEIAFELGFKYPQHFTRAFKKNTGSSPLSYRSLVKNED